jgi:hypothetical protein
MSPRLKVRTGEGIGSRADPPTPVGTTLAGTTRRGLGSGKEVGMLLGRGLMLALALAAGDDPARDAAGEKAREAVRSRLGASADRVHLVEVVPARWSDASLGCPEKGKVYAQVLTEGYQVRVRFEDRTFDVRVADGRAVVCGLGHDASEAAAGAAATTRLYRMARRDLAERLHLPEKEVRVDFIRPTSWPAGAPGCLDAAASPHPGSRVHGLIIQLSAGGTTYTYNSDMTTVRLCEGPK